MTYLEAFRQFQREYCSGALIRNKGNACAAADEAGVHRNTFCRIMQMAGVDVLAIRKQVRKTNRGRLGWRT